MIRSFVCLFLGSILLGCGEKHEATSGRDFYEKYRKAILNEDVDTVWIMWCRDSQEKMRKRIADAIEQARENKAFRESIQKRMGFDPTTVSAEHYLQKQLRQSIREANASGYYTNSAFVREKRVGDTVLLTVREKDRMRDLVLVWENGSLRFDMAKTQERIMNGRED